MSDENKLGVTEEQDVEEESGVKKSDEAHKGRVHTSDEPEEPKFDDAFETGESSSHPPSDFRDRAEDEEEDEWTHSEMEEYEDLLKWINDAVQRKGEAIRGRGPRKGKENRQSNKSSKRKELTSNEGP